MRKVATRGGIFGSTRMFGGGLWDGTVSGGFGAYEQAAAGLGQYQQAAAGLGEAEEGMLHAYDDGVFAARETMLDGPLQAFRDGSLGQYEQAAAGLGRGWSEEAGEKWLGGMGWTDYAGEKFMGGLGALPGYPQPCYDVETICGATAARNYGFKGEYDYLKSQYNDPACDSTCKDAIDRRVYVLAANCASAKSGCDAALKKKYVEQGGCDGIRGILARDAEEELVASGGGITPDGVFDANDCREWKRVFGKYPDVATLRELSGMTTKECPTLIVPNCTALVGGGGPVTPACGPGEVYADGKCVPLKCPAGQQLIAGKCEIIPTAPPQKKSKATMWIVGGLFGAAALTGLYFATRKRAA
jgi:hypothetical protein